MEHLQQHSVKATHKTITPFELEYTRKVNTFGLGFLACHLPILCGIAMWNGDSVLLTAGIALLLTIGPAAILARNRASALGAIGLAIAAMGMSALTIYVANGMIEAHFELFVLLAMLTVFGRIGPLLVAGTTIALHHLLFWMWLPSSVFNYQASLSIVLLHAFFVVLEVIPACWIARQFGKSIRAQGIVVEHLEGAADSVAATSREINAASNLLANAAARQATTVQETLAASEDMSTLSDRGVEASDNADKLMLAMAQQLDDANRDVTVMQRVVKDMVDSSRKISQVVKLIDGIAFQTNILSLNAAVEAASAGQYGAGFSVVAKEVGSLAQKSAKAATDTAELIEAALEHTHTGESAVAALGEAMGRVNVTAVKVKHQITFLNDSSHTQQQHGTGIKKSMARLDEVAQETAAGAEQSAAAGHSLEEQAEVMREIVARLQA